MHRKLMEVAGGCVDAKKVDRIFAATRKVDRRSTDAQKVDESCRKHPQPHRKLTEGDGRSHSRMECQGKVPRTFKS